MRREPRLEPGDAVHHSLGSSHTLVVLFRNAHADRERRRDFKGAGRGTEDGSTTDPDMSQEPLLHRFRHGLSVDREIVICPREDLVGEVLVVISNEPVQVYDALTRRLTSVLLSVKP